MLEASNSIIFSLYHIKSSFILKTSTEEKKKKGGVFESIWRLYIQKGLWKCDPRGDYGWGHKSKAHQVVVKLDPERQKAEGST
jgi:hypothetical protein